MCKRKGCCAGFRFGYRASRPQLVPCACNGGYEDPWWRDNLAKSEMLVERETARERTIKDHDRFEKAIFGSKFRDWRKSRQRSNK